MEIKEFTRKEVEGFLRKKLRPIKECTGKTLLRSYTDFDTCILVFTDGTFVHFQADASTIEESKCLSDLAFFENAELLPKGTTDSVYKYERDAMQDQHKKARYSTYLALSKEFGPIPTDDIK